MDGKSNTMTIIIIIIVLLVAGLMAYFIFTGMNNTEEKENDSTINDIIDDTEETEEKDITGAYTGTYNKNSNILEDAEDTITDDDSDEVIVELLLESDGKATFVKTGDTEEKIEGTYKANNDQIILTEDTNNTHTFDIKADGTLTYKDDSTSTDTVTLSKTDKDKLKHIKS